MEMRYSTEKIGINAGKLWASLSTNANQTLASLERTTELKRDEVLLALGWLFKEDKVAIETVGNSVKVSLK
jgi:hypothetical protein